MAYQQAFSHRRLRRIIPIGAVFCLAACLLLGWQFAPKPTNLLIPPPSLAVQTPPLAEHLGALQSEPMQANIRRIYTDAERLNITHAIIRVPE